ncbi:delta-aminolevulinic acid dehydratase [Cyclobacterium jeungdonense]|uniref:Delta-aminolevulinic acid dehydratase n=1 Tax=Cyclobacterium jeungdonense TaxID=708087 RepID=A0ABT8C2T1_9BACT|nr:delta-aminolevulinic acid dehydratase [Cyclobacterium jeungdonense]MDN3686616.1 delta-aminolevulinic acid dehydratase [Cyclobacterium jeungdonense]
MASAKELSTESTRFYDSFSKLEAFCEAESFKGYDPYDSLNSSLFQKIPLFSKSRIVKLAWTQFFKRAPLNLRPLVGVPKEYNPKALGLFLSSYCNLYLMEPKKEWLAKIHFFGDRILELQSKGWSGSCWGYNFDWQARAFFQPKYTPTVVATTFVTCSLLDAYELTKKQAYFDAARSACDFVLKDLYRTYDEKGNFSFSYSPLDKSVVFNASLLGARLLSRVYGYTKEEELYQEARKAVIFACDYQQENGAWGYGTLPFHQWIDNFHTGYNLECLSDFAKYTGDYGFDSYLQRGFKYYLETFFTKEGISKYYNNSVYPIDIHAPTQLVITLDKLGVFQENKAMAEKVMDWTIEHMQSSEGYFYYQINKYFTSRIPYMRWAQAWMFLSFTVFFRNAPTLYSKGILKKNSRQY